jgi:hypothetical protein
LREAVSFQVQQKVGLGKESDKGRKDKRRRGIWFYKSDELPLCMVIKKRKKFLSTEQTNYRSFKRAAATVAEYIESLLLLIFFFKKKIYGARTD